MKITLTNDNHNTSINLVVAGNKLSESQISRARRTLCGCAGCTCSNDLGMRGPQEVEIEPIYNGQTGKVDSAWVHFEN